MSRLRNRGKPGKGWRKLSMAVYEHESGLRIHAHGLALLPDGRQIFGTHWPESKRMHRYININGGCRRRGVMAWAKEWENDQQKKGGCDEKANRIQNIKGF